MSKELVKFPTCTGRLNFSLILVFWFPFKRTFKWPCFDMFIISLNMKTEQLHTTVGPKLITREVTALVPIVSVKLSLKIKIWSHMITTHRIHVWYIFAYIWPKNMVNVGKYIPYMDPLGYVTWVTLAPRDIQIGTSIATTENKQIVFAHQIGRVHVARACQQ